MTPLDPPPLRWSLGRRIGFRFLFAYLFLGLVTFPAQIIPKMGWLAEAYDGCWERVAAWVGEHGFGLQLSFVPNGSGDTSAAYVLLLCSVIAAGAITVVWSIIDRRRLAYPRLQAVLRVWVRYFLAYMMTVYGWMKVFHEQFPSPSFTRLGETYGESSPMGLLWAFMGFSPAYCCFTGAAEVLGGVLLLWRRTTTLGALILIAVLVNVVMLNFCFDVPVKLLSSELLLLSLWLVAPDVRRLLDVLVRNRATAPVAEAPVTRSRVRTAARVIAIALIVGLPLWDQLHESSAEQPAFVAPSGIYRVDVLTWNGVTRPPLLTDDSRWRAVIVSRRGGLVLRAMDASFQYDYLEPKDGADAFDVRRLDDDVLVGTCAFTEPDPQHTTFRGTIDGVTFDARLTRYPTQNAFLLTTRGFRWINEAPYNR